MEGSPTGVRSPASIGRTNINDNMSRVELSQV